MKSLMKSVAAAAAVCGFAANAGELPDEYELRPSIIAQADANGTSGTIPYINTGFAPNQDTHVIMLLDISDTTEYWFGAWDVDWNNKAFAMGNDGNSTYVGWHTQGGGVISTIPKGEHTLEIAMNGSVDDAIETTCQAENQSDDTDLRVCLLHERCETNDAIDAGLNDDARHDSRNVRWSGRVCMWEP